MRTTLTLDDDVASLLKREVRLSGKSFKETVNHHLRLGLTAARRPASKPFRVKPRELGLPAGMSYDNIGELLEALEGGPHK